MPAKKKEQKPESVPGLSLFKINEEMAIIRLMLDESGELTEAEDKYYCQLIDMAKKKCDGYIGTIGYIESQVEIGKAQIKLMQKRVKRWESIGDRLRDNLAAFMSNNGIKKLQPSSPVMPCAYLNNGRKKLEIDVNLLPSEYIKEEIVKKPNSEAIDVALKEDKTIPGVTVIVGDNYISIS